MAGRRTIPGRATRSQGTVLGVLVVIVTVDVVSVVPVGLAGLWERGTGDNMMYGINMLSNWDRNSIMILKARDG